ncbi:MAG: hypothetical protein Ta2G_09070 [Termitinemataceae bacterium]|nr:MAG: hypothetical protein Ta2G_09070 [Termitinemataceae bacterium]
MRIRFFGICVLTFSLLSFVYGSLKFEVVQQVLGAVFFVPLFYCFLGVLAAGLLYKKKAAALSTSVFPSKVNSGDTAYLVLTTTPEKNKKFVVLPAILIRYKLSLHTKDDRKFCHVFGKNIFNSTASSKVSLPFCINLRGAYYRDNLRPKSCEGVLLQDVFGFFYFQLAVQNNSDLCISVMPSPLDAINFNTEYSGTDITVSKNKSVKTDELLDSRVYVPGDDPRRINWKLFSHFSELFVRIEEIEKPPQSKLVLLLDTEADYSLFTKTEAASLLDTICSAALSLIKEQAQKNIAVELAYSGSKKFYGGDLSRQQELLSFPYITKLTDSLELPYNTNESSAVVFALPRKNHDGSQLSAFIENFFKHSCGALKTINVFFCYTKKSMIGISEANALQFYNSRKVASKAVQL